MIWRIEFKQGAVKELRKLSPIIQSDVIKYLKERIATTEDPRRFGKPLAYDKYGLWRYRVQDIRIICKICEDEFLVLVVRIGHRKDIYRF